VELRLGGVAMEKVPNQTEINLISPIAWVVRERIKAGKNSLKPNFYFIYWMGRLNTAVANVIKEISRLDETDVLQYRLIQLAAVAIGFCEAIRKVKRNAKEI